MTLLVFDRLTKEYPSIKALDNVSFAINPKDFVFIVGPSGAGKSTLLKMLIREDSPTSGAIYFESKNIFEISHKDLPELRRKIGVVFQDFKVLNSKTVFENVAVALEVVDTPIHVIKEVVPNVLSLVGLLDKVNSYPTMLSGGEKQRLAIARALAHEPEVIVADEPTGMIDPLASEDVMNVFEKVNSLGTTIIMSTHNQEIVNKRNKRVIRLQKGKVISDKNGGYNE
ncbi:ATP-binding cassette domain-containing protein [Candidatus Nomurabacteria bacterium]|nr:ATP-binding cassette domain-containing protein [Candidatus Nomurabacteria bacterium]